MINLFYILVWCISLAWLLIATSILLCQGQGARRVASAYGWVTTVLSMVKQTQSFHILTGYGPTPPSFILNIGRKHSR
jgi:uncharacterized membrane protein YoaK (UPF0700 family)